MCVTLLVLLIYSSCYAEKIPLIAGNSVTFSVDNAFVSQWGGSVTYIGQTTGFPTNGLLGGGEVGASDISLLFDVSLDSFTTNILDPGTFYIDLINSSGITEITGMGTIQSSGNMQWNDVNYFGEAAPVLSPDRIYYHAESNLISTLDTIFFSVSNLPVGGEIDFQGIGDNTVFVVPTSAVPVPGAVWLFVSGLMTIISFSRFMK